MQRHERRPLELDHVTGTLDNDQVGVRKRSGHRLAVRHRGNQVLGAHQHQRLNPFEHRQRGKLVVGAEGVVELRDHLDRHRRGHLLHHLHDRRADVPRTETAIAGEQESQVSARPAAALEGAGLFGDASSQQGQDAAGHRQDGSGQPEGELGELAGRRREQSHPDDAGPEQLRSGVSQRHDRHAAHRVADQDDRPAGRHGLKHGGQITTQLIDRRALRAAATGSPVRPVVVEHQPAGVVGRQGLPLVVPDGHLLYVAVNENNCWAGAFRSDLLDVQRHPVVGADPAGPIGGQREERLLGVGIRTQPGPTDGVTLRGEADGRPDRDDPHGRADQTAGRLHDWSPR